MKNRDVISKFLREERGKTTHLQSIDNKLINYSTIIAYIKDTTLYLNTTKYSRTTSTIQNELKRQAQNSNFDIVEYVG